MFHFVWCHGKFMCENVEKRKDLLVIECFDPIIIYKSTFRANKLRWLCNLFKACAFSSSVWSGARPPSIPIGPISLSLLSFPFLFTFYFLLFPCMKLLCAFKHFPSYLSFLLKKIVGVGVAVAVAVDVDVVALTSSFPLELLPTSPSCRCQCQSVSQTLLVTTDCHFHWI